MPDTRRTLAALQTLLADNTAGDISPQDMRDVLVSVFGGGLEPNAQTVTTTDITGAVGQMYVCTIAGLTANRNLTLPSATAGERVGVYIADGDDTYGLILKGAASQTINGGTAATEWSRVFIKGECVVFLCVAANTWIVESDRRIACTATMRLSANQTAVPTINFTKVLLNAEDIDIGGIAASNKITIRRAGTYAIGVIASISSVAADVIGIGTVWRNGAENYRFGRAATHGSTSAITASGSITTSLSVADYLELYVWHNSGSNETAPGGAATSAEANRMSVFEVFR